MKLRLTKAGRLVIFVLIVAILGTGGFFGYRYLSEHNPGIFESMGGSDADTPDSGKEKPTANLDATKTDVSDPTINLSLDEWIGWKSIIDANGGLTTQDGSIFDELGIKVNINIINDADSSSNALIKGSLNAAGYTVNRRVHGLQYPNGSVTHGGISGEL